MILDRCPNIALPSAQQHPPRLSRMRTRRVTYKGLDYVIVWDIISPNTPAMPLHDAHFGGFFVPEAFA